SDPPARRHAGGRGRGAPPAVPPSPLEVVAVVAEPVAQHYLRLRLRLPGQKTEVDRHLAATRNDVPLRRGLDHRRRGGEPEQRLDQLPGERIDLARCPERVTSRPSPGPDRGQ